MRNTEEVKQVNQQFIDYLAENLTKKDFDRLPDIMGIGPYTWTRFESRIAEFLDEKPGDIILRFGVAADRITVYELEKVLWEQGLKLSAVVHAA
jgi:hypothetical protein